MSKQLKKFFFALLLLCTFLLQGFLATAVANEIWVPPEKKDQNKVVGNWAVTNDGDTHFSFALPDNMTEFLGAKVVVIGKKDKDITYDLHISVARNMQRHDAISYSLTDLPETLVKDELLEIDVYSVFPDPLYPGVDYITLHFKADKKGGVRIIGMRFQYEGLTETDEEIGAMGYIKNADETDQVFVAWDKSTGISITESQISDLDHFTNADETDPTVNLAKLKSLVSSDFHSLGGTETDPVYAAWDKSTGISITETQITDLDHFTNADEADPVFGGSPASGVTSAGSGSIITSEERTKLGEIEAGADVTDAENVAAAGAVMTEADPVFGAWDKSTGISVTESQVSDLQHFTTADEIDPTVLASVKDGVSWTEVTGIPAGFADGTDDGITSESDPTVDLAKLQSLVTNDFHKLGGTDHTLTDGEIGAMGYIKNPNEADPVFGASDASGITSTDITNWNAAYAMHPVVPVGSVLPYAGSTAPEGWLLCDGASYTASGTYADLYAVIGYTYGGSADSFNVPNMRGRGPMGYSPTEPEFDELGKWGGEAEHQLTIDEMPQHRHAYRDYHWIDKYPKQSDYANPTGDVVGRLTYASRSTGYIGGSESHNNLQPYLTLNFIIKY